MKSINQSSVQDYYEKVLRDKSDNNENLFASVSSVFAQLLSVINNDHPASLSAIDLGYGYGNYCLAMADKGFHVRAVDYVCTKYFHGRLQSLPESYDITIEQKDLNELSISKHYDLVVCKDVLHFLNQVTVEKLLTQIADSACTGACHFLTIFTDIKRCDSFGNALFLEKEANYSQAVLCDLIQRVYVDWQLDIYSELYKESNRANPEHYYFRANRITVIAKKLP